MTDDAPPGADDALPGPPPRSQVGWAFGLVVFGLIAPAIAMVFVYRSCNQSTARGQIVADNTPLGSWRAPILHCSRAAGSTAEVSLNRESDTLLARVFYQGTTPTIELQDPSGNRTLRVDPTTCPGLTITVKRTPDGTIDLRGGSLFVDCALAAGGKITVDAWWQHCNER